MAEQEIQAPPQNTKMVGPLYRIGVKQEFMYTNTCFTLEFSREIGLIFSRGISQRQNLPPVVLLHHTCMYTGVEVDLEVG